MATQTRNPTSDIAATGTLSGSAGSRWTLVDDYPDTTGADSLTFGTSAATIVFGYSAFTVPAGSTSLSVQVLYYDGEAANGANNCSGRLRVGGTNFNAATHNPSGATYTSRTDNFATNPQTGAAWTVDQVNGTGNNALQGFGIHSTDSNPAFRVSSVQLQVTYTEAPNDIDGGGSATSSAATSAGSGSVITDATGSGSAAAASSAGTGAVTIAASGSAQPGAATSAGTGEVVEEEGSDVTGSGSGAATVATSSGAGSVLSGASGSAANAAATSSGTASVTSSAVGSPRAASASAVGTAALSSSGTGQSRAPDPEALGYGTCGNDAPSAAPTVVNMITRRRQMRSGRRR